MPLSGFSGFEDLLDTDGIALSVGSADKTAALRHLTATAARSTGIDPALILERVVQRETLGSTGFGGGVAIPHGRFDSLPGIYVGIAVLSQPIDFAAIDGQPVDIIVLLLSPQAAGADHLKALARISRTLRDPSRLALLRDAADVVAVRKALHLVEGQRQAA